MSESEYEQWNVKYKKQKEENDKWTRKVLGTCERLNCSIQELLQKDYQEELKQLNNH